MTEDGGKKVTKIVNAWADGDESLAGEVFEVLESELRQLARGALSRDDRLSGELEPGDLVNEIYLKLYGDFARNDRHFESTLKFKAMVRQAMRRLLIDLARKGGAEAPRRSWFTVIERIDEGAPVRQRIYAPDFYLALDRLRAKSSEMAEAIERHYIEGQTLDQVAKEMGLGRATINRRLAAAKQWMEIQLKRSSATPAES